MPRTPGGGQTSGSVEKEQGEERTMCLRTAQGPADGRTHGHTHTHAFSPQLLRLPQDGRKWALRCFYLWKCKQYFKNKKVVQGGPPSRCQAVDAPAIQSRLEGPAQESLSDWSLPAASANWYRRDPYAEPSHPANDLKNQVIASNHVL